MSEKVVVINLARFEKMWATFRQERGFLDSQFDGPSPGNSASESTSDAHHSVSTTARSHYRHDLRSWAGAPHQAGKYTLVFWVDSYTDLQPDGNGPDIVLD